jgi:hypothetical protein
MGEFRKEDREKLLEDILKCRGRTSEKTTVLQKKSYNGIELTTCECGMGDERTKGLGRIL